MSSGFGGGNARAEPYFRNEDTSMISGMSNENPAELRVR